MLPSRISVPGITHPESEDIFASSLSTLFTDDTQNSHGTPGQHIEYHSPTFGRILLEIPQHPGEEEGSQLFAHYLWNSGVVAAEGIERASNTDKLADISNPEERFTEWDRRCWDVRDADVLELGAGTALPSLISALSHARSVTITDHPSSPSLTNDTIQHNVVHNLKVHASDGKVDSTKTAADESCFAADRRTSSVVQIAGYVWGSTHFPSSSLYGKLANPQPQLRSFDKIIIADCLWMGSQHQNLIQTILDYLKDDPPVELSSHETRDTESELVSAHGDVEGVKKLPCALVVAGYHTGRSTVSRFFEFAPGTPWGNGEGNLTTNTVANEERDTDETFRRPRLRVAEIFELDVNCQRREWRPERPTESRDEVKRWCVCAALVRV